MSPLLAPYFEERLKSALPLIGIGSLAIVPAESAEGTPIADTGISATPGTQMKFPIVCEDSNLGWLRVEKLTRGPLPPATQEALESLALQVALVWKNPYTETILELDRVVSKLKGAHPYYDWCGVYLLRGESLHLVSFRGASTPHLVIAKTKGICGAAIAENKTLNIADVGADPRYLSCDSRTKSELVVPIHNMMGEAMAEIDIDSHHPASFTEESVHQVEELARELSSLMLKLA